MKIYSTAPLIKEHYLQVSPVHKIYVREFGNPNGIPVLRFHGGPGSMSKPKHTRNFNPDKFRIILFDQRGCGLSEPIGELKTNTTKDLIEDAEKIRKYLKIDKWVVFGGSWGSTLALAYSQSYPTKVLRLLVYGIFTFRKLELNLMTYIASNYYPDIWEKYLSNVPKKYHSNPTEYFVKNILEKETPDIKLVQNFYFWESNIMSLYDDPDFLDLNIKADESMIHVAKIFLHYEMHKGFMKDGELLRSDNLKKLHKIQTVIIQGRHDFVCPPITAWELHKGLPNSKIEIIDDSGHKASNWLDSRLTQWMDTFADELESE